MKSKSGSGRISDDQYLVIEDLERERVESQSDVLDQPHVTGYHKIVFKVVGEGQQRLKIGRRVNEVDDLEILNIRQ